MVDADPRICFLKPWLKGDLFRIYSGFIWDSHDCQNQIHDCRSPAPAADGGAFVASGVVAWAEATLDHRAIFTHYFHRIMPLGAGLTVLALLLGFLILNRLFRQYVTGMAAMVERLTVMLVSNRDLRLEEQGPPELRQVIAAMNRLADQRDHKIDEIEEQITDQQSMYAAICDSSKPGTDLDRPLSTLVYTAFDTETTGLQPSEGDEIIQIGALRVANGSLYLDDTFEKLIDPGRPRTGHRKFVTFQSPNLGLAPGLCVVV